MMISTVVFEIPTGALADIIGRKIALILAFLFYALALVVMAFSTELWHFIFVAISLGLSDAFYSGSLEALIYDTLVEHKQTDQYNQIYANKYVMETIGIFVASIVGGILYDINHQIPFLLMAAVYIVAAILSLLLKEPSIDSEKYDVSEFFHQNMVGFRELFSGKMPIAVVAILLIIGITLVLGSELTGELLLVNLGFSATQLGIVFSGIAIIGGVIAKFMPYIQNKLGFYKSLILTIIVVTMAFLLGGFKIAAVGVLAITIKEVANVLFGNISSDYINRHITSKNRATTLSTFSLIKSLPFAVLSIIIGTLIDQYTIFRVSVAIGIVFILLIFTVALLSRMENSAKA